MATSAPIWLFTGPEIGERNTAVDQIRATAQKAHGNLDYHTMYASDIRIGEVVSLLQNGSLFADARFVVLRNADEIKKKEDVEMLSSWIAESAGSQEAYLVLVSDEIGIDKKLEALVPKEQKRIFWELFENRKEQWITDFFRKAGMSIEEDAVASILDLVENNTDALKNACSRFTLFFPEGHRVTEADTENMLSHNREESAFTLFDDLAQGNLEGALGIFAKLSMSKESSPVQIIAGLTFCFRRLSDWHRIAASGETDEFSLKKAGFTSKKAIEQYRAASRRWDAPGVLRILSLLAQTDLSIRSGGGAIQNVQMEACLYAIHSRRGWPIAVAEYN